MKIKILIALSLIMTGCSLLGSQSKKTAEVVASCFSDGEDQESYCKAQRTDDNGKIVVTRCIGSKNQESKLELRGKCVEKICSEGSNTDCHVRGEFAVLEQYADLATAKLFSSEDSGKKKTSKSSSAKNRERSLASVAPPVLAPEVAASTAPVSPAVTSATATVTPIVSGPAVTAATSSSSEQQHQSAANKKEADVEKKPIEAPTMNLVLKPIKKQRTVASATKSTDKGFKRVCVAKSESTAPQILRGKCAVRNCAKGKCTYQGRKEMFDWVASNKSID